jgi:hypothetical protein
VAHYLTKEPGRYGNRYGNGYGNSGLYRELGLGPDRINIKDVSDKALPF